MMMPENFRNKGMFTGARNSNCRGDVGKVKFVSTIGESHTKIEGYSYEAFVNHVRSFSPSNVIVSYISAEEHKQGKYGKEIEVLLEDQELSDRVVFAGVDNNPYESFREQYFKDRSSSAEVLVKRNVLELIDSTVYSYLENYWKNADTVNSEITDSLFRAKHKIIASMFWDMEKYTWEERHKEILGNIRNCSTQNGSVIVTDVESRYWFLDHV